jgi:hypothetical protein
METHYYVFSHYITGIAVYERTCGTERSARRRVVELRRRRHVWAFYRTEVAGMKFWY